MKKSAINKPACYFDRYINQIEDIELTQAFQQSLRALEQLDLGQLNCLGDLVYAEGKWTSKEIFQHLIDTERILSYRALRIGRNDPTPLNGFDEAILAANVNPAGRTLESLIAEMKIVRQSSALLFESFDATALHRLGTASGIQMTPLAFGFTMLGHQKHHLDILAAKYLPLIA